MSFFQAKFSWIFPACYLTCDIRQKLHVKLALSCSFIYYTRWRDDPSQGHLVPEHAPAGDTSMWTWHPCITVWTLQMGTQWPQIIIKVWKLRMVIKSPKRKNISWDATSRNKRYLGRKNPLISFNLGTYWPERLIVQGQFVWRQIVMPPKVPKKG